MGTISYFLHIEMRIYHNAFIFSFSDCSHSADRAQLAYNSDLPIHKIEEGNIFHPIAWSSQTSRFGQ